MSGEWVPAIVILPLRYAFACLVVILATVARLLLDPILGDRVAFATYFIAVILSARYLGLRPALITCFLSLFVADYLFVPPRHTLLMYDLPGWVSVILYLAVSMTVIFLYETDRKNKKRLAEEIERHKETSVALLESRKKLQMIADSVPVLISSVDRDYRYTFRNKAHKAWFGQEGESIEGCHVSTVLGEAAYQQIRPYLEKALMGEPQMFEISVPHVHGGKRHVRITYIPQLQENQCSGIYILVEDITDLKERTDRLSALNDAYCKANERLLSSQQELQDKINELEIFHDMVVGRELKMMQLEKEIKNLKMDRNQ
jgi:PAS domain S-box-containing protein